MIVRMHRGRRKMALSDVPDPPRFDDPSYVREQYATEDGLAARASVYGAVGNPPHDFVLEELMRLEPRRVLDVGCGRGELAERIVNVVGCEVAAVDSSPRMVELTRARGIDAQVGDVQSLPLADGSFDAAVAAWMLYHVPDLDRGLGQLARVLRPAGALIATTNGGDDLGELWRLVGRDPSQRVLSFAAETGEEHLRRHFAAVRRHDFRIPVMFDETALRTYVGSSELGSGYLDRVPELDEPFVATKLVTVFVATR